MEENNTNFSNDNVYATVNPTEKSAGYDNNAGNTGYANAGYGNAGAPGGAGYGNPGYNAGYNNTGYNNTGYNNTGYNNTAYNNTAYNQNSVYNTRINEVRCPGKEITSMVLGIVGLVYGALGVVFCWHPVFAWTFGLFGVGCGIPANILHNQVMKIATVTTNKVKLGKRLGIAGIICGAVAMVLDIIVIFVFAVAIGASWAEFY